MVRKRPRCNLGMSLIRRCYGVENPVPARARKELSIHRLHRPRHQLLLSLPFASLSQPAILRGLSTLSGLSGMIGQLCLAQGYPAEGTCVPIAEPWALT